jgi:hypothetical protein
MWKFFVSAISDGGIALKLEVKRDELKREISVLAVESMKMALSVVVLCSLVEVYRRFRGSCWLHECPDSPDDGGRKQLKRL